jgi:hypothetical protein
VRRWLALTVISALATAADPGTLELDTAEVDAIFVRFDHAKHAKAFGKASLPCSGCHQVGATGDARLSDEALDRVLLRPPESSCHFCHNPPNGGVPFKGAPTRCDTCHDTVPAPPSHGAGWISAHGVEARLSPASCESCHRRDACIDCHERQTPVDFKVHDRSWLSVHGIAARTNPSECATCHLQADCVECHAGGAP